MVVETLRQYTVENLTDNGIKYFFIQECEALEMVLLPAKYLKHKTVMNCSYNTVKNVRFCNLLVSLILAGEFNNLIHTMDNKLKLNGKRV